jgi:partner of Y14 and mago protein
MAEDRKMPSVRPDGTVRKEVKVRPGYMPAEMVKKYVIPARRDKAEVNNEREKPK